MYDLSTIADAVQAALVTVTQFEAVEHGASKEAREKIPAAVHYLLTDNEDADDPTVDRVMTWAINIFAPVTDAAGNYVAVDLVQAVLAAFRGAGLTVTGYHVPVSIARVQLTDMTDVLLTYQLELKLLLQPTV